MEALRMDMLHSNIATYMKFVWTHAGAKRDNGGNMEWVMTEDIPLPFANLVLGTRRWSKDFDQEVLSLMEQYHQHRLPILWYVFPDDEPSNLSEILIANQFEEQDASPGMAMRLKDLPKAGASIPDLTIVPVDSPDKVDIFSKLRQTCFGVPPILAERFLPMFHQTMQGPDKSIHGYIGYMNEEPIAVASVYCSNGVAGIYNVGTIETQRGRGIGREMTRLPLQKAYEQGNDLAVLMSSPSGYGVYRKLGFKDVGQVRMLLRNV